MLPIPPFAPFLAAKSMTNGDARSLNRGGSFSSIPTFAFFSCSSGKSNVRNVGEFPTRPGCNGRHLAHVVETMGENMKDHVFDGRPARCSIEELIVHFLRHIGLKKHSEMPVVGIIDGHHIRNTVNFKSIPITFEILRPGNPDLFSIQNMANQPHVFPGIPALGTYPIDCGGIGPMHVFNMLFNHFKSPIRLLDFQSWSCLHASIVRNRGRRGVSPAPLRGSRRAELPHRALRVRQSVPWQSEI